MSKNTVWIGGGLAACLVLIAAAYLWATGTMAAIYAYRSPLKDAPPAPGQPANAPLTGRVVVVLIDALRYDTSTNSQVMPVLAELRARGASARMHSRPPSYSEPGYTTLLTGAWPDINDGPPVNLEYEQIHTFTQDDLFSAAQRAGSSTAIAGYYWFEKLVPQSAVDAAFYTPGEDAQADREVVDAALPWLRDGAAELVLIHLDQVDYAGHHEGGPRDPRWNEAASRADLLLGEILAELDLDTDTLLVVSDHGQIDRGGHGGTEPVTLLEPFVLAGKGVLPGGYQDVQMVDVAPTLAVLLGTGLPASSEGRPLLEMLAISPEQKGAVEAAHRMQQAGLADAYRAAIGMTPPLWTDATPGAEGIRLARAARLARERWPRLLYVGLGFLAAGRLLYGDGRWRRSLMVATAAYLATFVLGYELASGRTLTLSAAQSEADLLLTTGGWALAGLLVAAGWYALRSGVLEGDSGERAAGALRLVLSIAYALALAVGVSYVLNGWGAAWSLPEMDSAFIALLAAVQVLVVAAVGSLVALGLLAARRPRQPAPDRGR